MTINSRREQQERMRYIARIRETLGKNTDSIREILPMLLNEFAVHRFFHPSEFVPTDSHTHRGSIDVRPLGTQTGVELVHFEPNAYSRPHEHRSGIGAAFIYEGSAAFSFYQATQKARGLHDLRVEGHTLAKKGDLVFIDPPNGHGPTIVSVRAANQGAQLVYAFSQRVHEGARYVPSMNGLFTRELIAIPDQEQYRA